MKYTQVEVRAYLSGGEFPTVYPENFPGKMRIFPVYHLPRVTDRLQIQVVSIIWTVTIRKIIHPLQGDADLFPLFPVIVICAGSYLGRDHEREGTFAHGLWSDEKWTICEYMQI